MGAAVARQHPEWGQSLSRGTVAKARLAVPTVLPVMSPALGLAADIKKPGWGIAVAIPRDRTWTRPAIVSS
jgi:hypothetical protein